MPGPKPTPTKVLEARDSWRAKTRRDEPQPVGSPDTPDWLTGEALEAWQRIIPQLDRIGLLGETDQNALARYCQLYGRWRECEQFIAEHGMIDDDGRERPQVNRAGKIADQMLRLEQQFGLSPSARAGLAKDDGRVPKKKNDDDVKRFTPKLSA